MNGEYVEGLRTKLHRRVERLVSTNNLAYHYAIQQFVEFITKNQLFAALIKDLERRYPDPKEQVSKNKNGTIIFPAHELEHVAYALSILKECASNDQPCEAPRGEGLAARQTRNVRGTYEPITYDAKIGAFNSVFVKPLSDYLDEHLEDERIILALLERYKHKCEWFQRDYLLRLWSDNTSRGEKLLAMNLYEYLHDQGLDFTIEPSSVSGEADLVAAQKTDDPLIADVKIYNPEKGKDKRYIASGFRQLYTYTMDFNEPFGYLVVFKTCPHDLRFALSNQSQGTPFVVHNNKTIFLLTIDIAEYDKSASKRGPLEADEITEDYLIRIMDSPETASSE